jgi:hypothetical protein
MRRTPAGSRVNEIEFVAFVAPIALDGVRN